MKAHSASFCVPFCMSGLHEYNGVILPFLGKPMSYCGLNLLLGFLGWSMALGLQDCCMLKHHGNRKPIQILVPAINFHLYVISQLSMFDLSMFFPLKHNKNPYVMMVKLNSSTSISKPFPASSSSFQFWTSFRNGADFGSTWAAGDFQHLTQMCHWSY